MDLATIFEQLRERLTALFLRILDFIPALLVALLVLLLGWLVARLAAALVGRASTSALRQLTRLGSLGKGADSGLVHESAPRIASSVVFWAVLLVFVAVAVDQLPVPIIADLFERLAQYLPDLILAIGIVLAGIVLGVSARHAIVSGARTAGLGNPETLGRLGQAGLVTAAALVAADQIGVESTLLIVAFAIALGSALGGIALAFGIGSGLMVGNLIAARNVRRLYRAGQSVRIGAVEGRIVEIGPAGVVLDTPEGTVHVPARRFSEEISMLVREKAD